ncbi:Ankyrin repeat [Dillenia turbinata]|uniref:Ankyrin repeat n=1 Tax=Dillenia turbinata TaxID=194707 RepID=A0AAN8VB05_9MAGN
MSQELQRFDELLQCIVRDDKKQLLSLSERVFEVSLNGDALDWEEISDTMLPDRGIVSKLLHFCCTLDAVECASCLINGELGVVPLVNEIEESGKSPLHTAAENHSVRCIELLIRKRARTDDLTAVKLLTEKTKDVAEMAYSKAMEGSVVPLAVLLMVATEKLINAPITVPRTDDADIASKDKATMYESVIREALASGRAQTTSSRVGKRMSGGLNKTEIAEKRNMLLCALELLQLFGALPRSAGCTDRKIISPLIRAAQDILDGSLQAADEEVVELLLKTSINVNDTDAEGNSALHWSLKMPKGSSLQEIRVVWLLLKYGAQICQRNKLGLTAAHMAAANGNFGALQGMEEFFLKSTCFSCKQGPHIEIYPLVCFIPVLEDVIPQLFVIMTEMKETPLFFAAKNDQMECAQLLLNFGANTEVLNLRRQRPIDLAKSQDMRFILSPTNIGLTSRVFPKRVSSLSVQVMKPEGTKYDRVFQSPKTEICKFFESPSGCIRGAKCFYAHGEEEFRKAKHGRLFHSLAIADLKRKIFIGGLPPSLKSDGLHKIFEEQFGAVEDAVVIGNQTSGMASSRGFGFVTFKNQRSVAAAVQVHYIEILGKYVEIKSAIPKCILLEESQKTLEHQAETPSKPHSPQAIESTDKAKEGERSDEMSWADRVFQYQPKACPNEPQVSDSSKAKGQNVPAWLITFKNWLPDFLQDVSKRLEKGEWYPLSSLKADFRATGLELDHASLGYSKLSDFMRLFSDLCHMKVVPVGGRGAATHVVLLPNLPSSPNEKIQPMEFYCTAPTVESPDDNFYFDSGTKVHEDLLWGSCKDGEFLWDCFDMESSSQGDGFDVENSSEGSSERNLLVADPTPGVPSSFLEFLKSDPVFHARPWLSNRQKDVHTIQENEVAREGSNLIMLWQSQRHPVLEALSRKRMNSSIFFLREFDYYENYKASLEQGMCFGCSKRKILWANFPCKHLLWCGDCKLQAIRVAGAFEHKCVICDAKVEKIGILPWYEKPRPICRDSSNVEEFPPFDPNRIRNSLKKKKSPMGEIGELTAVKCV